MMSATSRSPPPLPRATYVLLLLDADNGAPIRGRTRLEKLTFLVQMRIVDGLKVGVTQESYRFRPFHYGPYTEEVFDDLMALQMLGLVSIVGDDEAQQTFAITPRGHEAVQRLVQEARVTSVLVDEIRKIKATFGRMNLDQLVQRVYTDYPQYTEKSHIKDRYLY